MARKDFQEILFIESAQGPFSRLDRVVHNGRVAFTTGVCNKKQGISPLKQGISISGTWMHGIVCQNRTLDISNECLVLAKRAYYIQNGRVACTTGNILCSQVRVASPFPVNPITSPLGHD